MPRQVVIGLIALLLCCTTADNVSAQYQCDPVVCVLPDCHCASVDPPGGLNPADIPQFILVSFDDGVMDYWESFVTDLLRGLQNPGGRKTLRTYFVNIKDSDPALIKKLYDDGHEIANHTATHTTSDGTTAEQWREEIRQLERFLNDVAGISPGDVVGFRAPFLATNEAMWQTLGELGFLYDSSVGEQPTYPPTVSLGLDQLVWPHTMDFGLPLSCYSSLCPEEPVRGLWTIPMWAHFEDPAVPPHGMDPYAGYPDLLGKALRLGFDERYEGNRAPLGLYLHRGPLAAYPTWAAELRTFLEEALSRPDVWMITMRGLIEWMKAPVPADQMAAWFDAACYQGSCPVGQAAESVPAAADEMLLSPPYPNPFRAQSRLTFVLPESGHVDVAVYDLLGRRVVDVVDGWRAAGRHEVVLDGAGLSRGAYFAVLQSGSQRATRMVVLAE